MTAHRIVLFSSLLVLAACPGPKEDCDAGANCTTGGGGGTGGGSATTGGGTGGDSGSTFDAEFSEVDENKG